MFDKDNKFGFINNNNNNENLNNTDIKKYVDDKVTIKILPVDYNKNCVTNVIDLEPHSIYMSPNDAKFLYLAYEKLSGTLVGFCFSAKPHGRFIYTGDKDDTKIEIMIEGSCYTVYFKTDTVDAHVEKTVFYLTKNNTTKFMPTNDYEPATKKYVDDNIPLTEDNDKYIFKKTITKTINFNDTDIITNTGNFPSVIKNLEITNELSGKEILSVKIESDNGITCINNIKEYYLNGATLIINDSTTKDTNGKAIQFMITFNRKAINDNNVIQYEENKDYCTFTIRSKESGKHPLNDYNRSKIWTVTFTYYEDNPNYYTVLYNLPTNIENGSSKDSIQQTGNMSTGVFALGNKNNGKGYLLGASNSSENTSCIFGKGNKGIGTTPGYIIGEGNASHGTGGGFTFGSSNTVEGTTIAVGRKLNTNAPKDSNRGAMIIGQGGTLADDTRFAISTSNTNCTETRYPFEAKEDGSTYLRGKNVLLETEGDILEDKAIVNKKYVDDNILLEQLPILRMDETNKRIYINCNNMGTYKKYFVPNKYANVYSFSFIYTNDDNSETEIALIGGAMTRDDFVLCARNTNTLFILILGGTDKYTYTKSTKVLEKGLFSYLKIGNTQEYTPTTDYNPATKKYVDDKVSNLPQFSFNEAGELIVTINGVSKTFVPKDN